MREIFEKCTKKPFNRILILNMIGIKIPKNQEIKRRILESNLNCSGDYEYEYDVMIYCCLHKV